MDRFASDRPLAAGSEWSRISVLLRHSLWALLGLAVAPFLTSAEFGLAALALVAANLFAVAHRVVSGGLVQQRRVTFADAAGCFWLTAGTGLAALGVLWLAAAPVGEFFGEPLLALLLPMVGLITFLDSAGIVPAALLQREQRTSTLAVAQVTAGIAGITFALALAAGGAGLWSLIYGRLLGAGLELAVLWWYAPVPLLVRPVFPASVVNSDRALAQTAGFAGRNADKMLIGAGLGTAALGMYQLAFDLAVYPLTLAGQWVAGVVCRVGHPEGAGFDERVLRAIRAVALVSFPVGAVVGGAAMDRGLVESWLDPSWSGLGGLLLIFAALAALVPVCRVADIVFAEVNATESRLQWPVASLVATVAAAAFALPFGIAGVALAVSVSFLAVLLLASMEALWLIRMPVWTVASALGMPAAASAATGLVAYLWLNLVGNNVISAPAPVQLLTAAGLSAAFYLGLLRTLRPLGMTDLGLAVAQLPAPLAKTGLMLLGLPAAEEAPAGTTDRPVRFPLHSAPVRQTADRASVRR